MQIRTQTLELNPKTLRLPFQTLFVLLAMVLVLEFVFRNPTAQQYLPIPSLGTANRVFEQKAILLDNFVEQNQSLDCIFVGNSTTRRAVDPSTMATAYRAETGNGINCFNFGVPGLTTETSYEVSQWLIKEYEPTVILYGTTMRDPIEMGSASQVFDSIAGSDWFKYKNGEFNFRGWLTDHSYVMRYTVYVSNWVLPGPVSKNFKPGQILKYQQLETDGYTLVQGQLNPDRDLTIPPDPALEPKYFNMVSEYDISDKWLAITQQFVDLRQDGTEVIFYEIPLPEYALNYAQDEFTSYHSFTATIAETFESSDATFISTQNDALIPTDGWYDRSHMNWAGAEAFSRWMGSHLAELAKNGDVALPLSNP